MPQMSASEYRIQATDPTGRAIQRYITAMSMHAARKRAKTLAKNYGWKKIAVDRKNGRCGRTVDENKAGVIQ